jgi:hypothetical protein
MVRGRPPTASAEAWLTTRTVVRMRRRMMLTQTAEYPLNT